MCLHKLNLNIITINQNPKKKKTYIRFKSNRQMVPKFSRAALSMAKEGPSNPSLMRIFEDYLLGQKSFKRKTLQ